MLEMAKRNRKKRDKSPMMPALVSQPTDERMRHAGAHWDLGGDDRGGAKIITLRDSPLERARDRGVLGKGEIALRRYGAGERYRMHWYRAGMAGRLGSWNPDRVDGDRTSETEAALHHRQEYAAAVRHLGLILSAILDSIVCHEKAFIDVLPDLGWKSRAKGCEAVSERLVVALDSLCELWGL